MKKISCVYAHNISDHCAVAIVRNEKLLQIRPCIITRRCMSQISEPGFVNDLVRFGRRFC